MGHLADRKLLAVAAAVTASGATLFGLVGWFAYDSRRVAILAAVTVLGEGTAVIIAVYRWETRRRRRTAERRNETKPTAETRDGWVPEGWDIPWDEKLRHPPEPPD